MTDALTMTAAEIADLLGIKVATFMRKRRDLYDAGFPRPLPTGSLSPVWSRRLVEAWISSGGASATPDALAEVRSGLEARIGGAA